MPDPKTYAEWEDAQAPALHLLGKLGYTVLSPEEALVMRDGSTSEVLLRDVLEAKLREINRIHYKGRTYAFSDGNIHEAVEALRTPVEGGLVHTNEHIYDLLTLGKSFEQEIEGDRKSHPLWYVDWEEPEKNAFHVVPEFVVTGRSGPKRPDLVCFVNGIPFAIIECKRRDKNDSVGAGIRQMLKYQQADQIRPLFYYAQMLLSVQPNEVRYGTVKTPEEYWSVWKEDEAEAAVYPLVQDRGEGAWAVREQDRSLWSLLRPDRLLDLTYGFVVFDAGKKKIARYQQYFTVKSIMERVQHWDEQGRRRGGVIYHTQGSGKSLTMVCLAKALALSHKIKNPRVILVTDRKDLDRQLTTTFLHCGKDVARARSGAHLAELIADDHVEVVATLVNKFNPNAGKDRSQLKTAVEREGVQNLNPNIFVLVDESHRTQYGTLHALMRKALPNACYLGFTGTPLLKKEKNTARKFGGIIPPTYPMVRAVEDKAVVPLLYEGREPRQIVYATPLDRAFERISEPLSEEQRTDLKQKATTKRRLNTTRHRLEEVVHDLVEHYCEHWQGTGLKAQFCVSSKSEAVEAFRLIEEIGRVRPARRIKAAVVISPPDLREDLDDDEDPKKEVVDFWKEHVDERFGGDEERYEEHVLSRFNDFQDDDPGIELLIVVSKLLTGFDAPRSTVLYINKEMKEHTLLQAIARVNRLFPEKEYGYIVDYWDILEEMDRALSTYSALSGYEEGDLEHDLGGALKSIRDEVDKLGQYHSDLLDIFAGVPNKADIEALEQHLKDEERRDDFYERLTVFSRTLQTALASQYFYDDERFPPALRQRYVKDARFFHNLRQSVRCRYHEAVVFSEYERQVQKLLDTHIAVEAIEQVVPPTNVLDTDALAVQVEMHTGKSAASRADEIAHRTKRTITERMDENPVLYRRLSELIQEAIEAYHQHRLDARQYLARVEALEAEARSGIGSHLPAPLRNRPQAAAYFELLGKEIKPAEEEGGQVERLVRAGIHIEDRINALKIVDWRRNPDVAKRMASEVEDYLLFESGLIDMSDLGWKQRLDLILEKTLLIAKSQDH